MRLLSLSLAGLLLATAGCQKAPSSTDAAPAGQLMQSGFEESLGWNGANPAVFSVDKAHQGKVAAVVSPTVPFGYTYARTLGQLGLAPGAQKLELSGWVLRTAAGSTAHLVAQLDASPTDEKRVYYTSLPLADAVKPFGEWQEVHLPISLPAEAVATNNLKIYLWNSQGTSPTYLDDVVLRRVAAQ